MILRLVGNNPSSDDSVWPPSASRHQNVADLKLCYTHRGRGTPTYAVRLNESRVPSLDSPVSKYSSRRQGEPYLQRHRSDPGAILFGYWKKKSRPSFTHLTLPGRHQERGEPVAMERRKHATQSTQRKQRTQRTSVTNVCSAPRPAARVPLFLPCLSRMGRRIRDPY